MPGGDGGGAMKLLSRQRIQLAELAYDTPFRALACARQLQSDLGRNVTNLQRDFEEPSIVPTSNVPKMAGPNVTRSVGF